MKETDVIRCDELTQLCISIREMVANRKLEQCGDILCKAMALYPHAPQPHNLLGVVLEKQGKHPLAMKHFQAAWALDPTYAPAGQNLATYGTFLSHGSPAFDESDCRGSSVCKATVEQDSQGLEHFVRRRI